MKWLQHLDVSTPGALWLDGERQLRIRDWTYCGGSRRLGDLISWEWISPKEVVFAPTRRSYPLVNEHATQFKRLCGAVIVTYPHLLSFFMMMKEIYLTKFKIFLLLMM